MKKFVSIALCSALIISLCACKDNGASNGASTDVSASDSVPAGDGTPADTSADTADTTASSAPDATASDIEEVPYVLGGELTPTMIANSRLNVGNQVRLAKRSRSFRRAKR